jgi:hypothetical protein
MELSTVQLARTSKRGDTHNGKSPIRAGAGKTLPVGSGARAARAGPGIPMKMVGYAKKENIIGITPKEVHQLYQSMQRPSHLMSELSGGQHPPTDARMRIVEVRPFGFSADIFRLSLRQHPRVPPPNTHTALKSCRLHGANTVRSRCGLADISTAAFRCRVQAIRAL